MKTKRRTPKKKQKCFNFGKVAAEKPLEKQGWNCSTGLKMVNGAWV